VEDARDAVRADEDVLGRHVTMDEPERLAFFVVRFVRRVEPVEDARDDRARDTRRDGLLERARAPDELRERIPAYVLHHEEELVLLLRDDDVERRDDVRMMDARRETRFVEQHRRELGVARVLRMQSLYRDRAEESGGTDEPSEMDGGHASRRDRVVDG